MYSKYFSNSNYLQFNNLVIYLIKTQLIFYCTVKIILGVRIRLFFAIANSV